MGFIASDYGKRIARDKISSDEVLAKALEVFKATFGD
jgi:hypothetical protein